MRTSKRISEHVDPAPIARPNQARLPLDSSPPITRRHWLAQVGVAGVAAELGGNSLVQMADAAEDSQAGSQLLVACPQQGQEALRGMFMVDPEKGTWRRIVDESSIQARLSPDGRSLLYARAEGAANSRTSSYWICSVDGQGEPRKVTESATRAMWSPDGKEILLSSTSAKPGEGSQNWFVGTDGSNRRKLDLPGNEYVVDWSADGQWLLTWSKANANDSDRLGLPHNVYVRKRDGSGSALLVEGKNHVWHRFRPDSREVCYVLKEDGPQDVYSLFVINRDRSALRKLIPGTPELFPFFFCWSPDGQRIAVDLLESEKADEGQASKTRRRIQLFTAAGKPGRTIELPHEAPFPVDWK